MHAWESIQSTLDYIELHLSEEIQIQELANIAHLSPFYFQRLFTRLVGKPVMEYKKLRCLAKAADYLATHKDRILDIALQFGFESHETFTRSFKSAYGLTPEVYRQSPRQLSHFLKPDLLLKYVLVDENVPIVVNNIVLEIKRTQNDNPHYFAGYTIVNSMADTPGIDFLGELWNKFHEKKETFDNLIPNGNEAGVSYPSEQPGCFTYFAGAEVTKKSDEPGINYWTLPAGEYAICAFEAENFYQLATEALNKARDYFLGTWMPKHKIQIDPFMLELYFNTSPEATYMELWFKIKSN